MFVCLDLCVGGCLCVWVWGESLRVRGVRGECVNSCFKSKERVVKSTFHLVHIMIRSVFAGVCVSLGVCVSVCVSVRLCLSVCHRLCLSV